MIGFQYQGTALSSCLSLDRNKYVRDRFVIAIIAKPLDIDVVATISTRRIFDKLFSLSTRSKLQ